MPNIVLDLEVNRVDLVDEGANSEAFIKLYKRKESCTAMNFDEILAKMKPEHAQVIMDELNKAKKKSCSKAADCTCDECTGAKMDVMKQELAKAKEDLEKANEELAKANETVAKAKSDPSEEEVIKGLDPAVQEIFKSLKAEKEAAEMIAKQLKDKEETEVAKAKAAELKALPVDEAKLVEIAKSATDEVYEVLKAASKLIENGPVLGEVGKSKGSTDSQDAWSKIEKKADEIVESDKVTKQKAIAKVIRENPELYKEYLKGGAN